ncbi:CDP-glycerol glycerophosphotransferase family protein [Microbacterium halophytorum]|uniref:CDP-glycerol glycerophosphotransferase family protein n=1 Tax=Microbacterium halophytorum TaxID=2067568 RepID=UPI000CFCC817|nr:CDP-glycerol glycerophosphotransferase family protein [Microbacterium halophytorum]
MASFSFRSGNAAKLLRAPLYALGRLATLVVPRGDRWVFGCGAGVGDGPLEVWRAAAADGTDAVWLAADDEEASEAAALGMPVVRRDSFRGFWATARARTAVVAFGLGDVNPYALSGAFVVQLWHGIPLKRIGLDSPETTRSPIPFASGAVSRALALAYAGSARRIDVVPASHARIRGRLESAFALPYGRVVVTGEPRVDPLSAGAPDQRRAEAVGAVDAAAGSIPEGAARVLYAPTWRDGEDDPGVPTDDEWRDIIDVLERNGAVLYVRSHRLGSGRYAPPTPSARVRDLGSDRLRDITPALPAFDVLITDYSSLLFDAALVPVPAVMLAPDPEEYAATRGFYGNYEAVAGGDYARDWPGAVEQLDAVLGDDAERAARIRRAADLSASVHAYRDGGNAERLYRTVRARLGDGDRRGSAARYEGKGHA